MDKNFKQITTFYDHLSNAAIQQNLPLDVVIESAASWGVQGVEMDYALLEQEGPALAHKLAFLGLPINCCYCHFDWANHPEDTSYIKVLENLREARVNNMLVIPGFADGTFLSRVFPDAAATDAENAQLTDGEHAPDMSPEKVDLSDISRLPIEVQNIALCRARELMLPNMIHLLEKAKEYHINVLMEDYDDLPAPFATAEQVKWFLDRLPDLGCAFDTGNFLYSEEDVIDAYELLKSRIKYVHCKDRSFTPVDGEEPKSTVLRRQMYSAATGSGIIPMKTIIAMLKRDGYEGTYAIEHFGSVNQYRDIKRSAEFMKKNL